MSRRVMYHSYYFNDDVTADTTVSISFPPTCDYVRIEYAFQLVNGVAPSINIRLQENQFNNLTCDVLATGVLTANASGKMELSNPSPTMSLLLDVGGTDPVVMVEIVVVIGNDC